jgi:hypothetical protein
MQRRGEVEGPAWMAGQPGAHLWHSCRRWRGSRMWSACTERAMKHRRRRNGVAVRSWRNNISASQYRAELFAKLALLTGAREIYQPAAIQDIEAVSSQPRLQQATHVRFEQNYRDSSIRQQVIEVLAELLVIAGDHFVSPLAVVGVDQLVGWVHEQPAARPKMPADPRPWWPARLRSPSSARQRAAQCERPPGCRSSAPRPEATQPAAGA